MKLMYVGITHETATVKERTYYALTESQKQDLVALLKQQCSIKALTIVSTCNRTEIYFESAMATPYRLREVLIQYVEEVHQVKLSRDIFLIFDRTIDTVNHLLHVANGLRSAVMGDKQIIYQIKESYLASLKQQNQGTLLERAFQAVFRSHKRILKESLYKQGSISTAYSSLKMIEAYFGKEESKNLKILIVGAGEIAEDVLRYLPKFHFAQTFISNRTAEKALAFARQYQIETYDWEYVESNDFSGFDVIITAVSNRRHLVKNVKKSANKRLWIDLAMPSNIDTGISDYYNKVYNIDEVALKINAVNDAQLKAVPIVENILKEELTLFIDWLKKDKIRGVLSSYKSHIKQVFASTAPEQWTNAIDAVEMENFAERLANKLVRKSAKTLNNLTSGDLTSQQLNIIKQAFGASL